MLICNYALDIEQYDLKSLYRKSQCLIKNPSAGTIDLQKALKILYKLTKLYPNNTNIYKHYQNLKNDLKQQNLKDRQTFTGLFDRGTIYDDDDNNNKNNDNMNKTEEDDIKSKLDIQKQEVSKRIYDARMYLSYLKKQGNTKKAKKIQEQIINTQRLADQGLYDVILQKNNTNQYHQDWSNPNEIMKHDAKKFGVDLNDPDVLNYLNQMDQHQQQQQQQEDDDKPEKKIVDQQDDLLQDSFDYKFGHLDKSKTIRKKKKNQYTKSYTNCNF